MFPKRYELVRVIGKGGFGEVWEGRQTLENRSVAIKVIDASKFSDEPMLMDRLYREVQIAIEMKHRNIVRVLDWIDEVKLGDRVVAFIVLELIEGKTLAQISASKERLDDATIRRIGIELLSALEHLHTGGYLHRDIKPSNVMLSADGEVKLLDFGVAHSRHDTGLTARGDVVGTIHYMAPEQAAGEPVDERTDTYAVGQLLYELITGKNYQQAQARMQLTGAQPTVAALWRPILAQALESRPQERFATAEAMRKALERLDLGPADDPPSIPGPAGWKRHRGVLASLAAVGLGLLVALLMFFRQPATQAPGAIEAAELPKPASEASAVIAGPASAVEKAPEPVIASAPGGETQSVKTASAVPASEAALPNPGSAVQSVRLEDAMADRLGMDAADRQALSELLLRLNGTSSSALAIAMGRRADRTLVMLWVVGSGAPSAPAIAVRRCTASGYADCRPVLAEGQFVAEEFDSLTSSITKPELPKVREALRRQVLTGLASIRGTQATASLSGASAAK